MIEHLHIEDAGKYAYNLISSLIHGDSAPQILLDNGDKTDATQSEIVHGTTFVKHYITDFEYKKYLYDFFKKEKLLQLYNTESCNYIKLQIFRVFIEIANERSRFNDDILLKFIDEVYHIENDYIYYLDVLAYDVVPEYIINKCNTFVSDFMQLGASV